MTNDLCASAHAVGVRRKLKPLIHFHPHRLNTNEQIDSHRIQSLMCDRFDAENKTYQHRDATAFDREPQTAPRIVHARNRRHQRSNHYP